MDATNTAEMRGDRAWTPATRVAFRVAFVYFGLFFVGAMLDSGRGPRKLLAVLSAPPVRWFGHTVLRLGGSPNDGGAPWAIAQQTAAVLVALVIAAAWSLVSRRVEYRRLHGWFRLALRYYVAAIMLTYGGFKVVESQFPPLSLDQLAQPLGEMAPMSLLWAFMGYSTTYATFTGLGESVGAFLLFFRRTATAGALILVAVLSNVALLNYAFDVPVKQLSSNLLLAAIVLVLPDVRRLIAVLLLNQPSQPADLTFELPRWLQRARRFVKPAVIVVATCAPLIASSFVRRRLIEQPMLFGMYDVDRFTRNGTVVPPVLTESTRWRRVAFGRPGAVSIRLMNDSMRTLNAAVDTVHHRITLSSQADARITHVIAYATLANDGLRLWGVQDADTVDVTLRRLDHQTLFRLLR